MLKRIPVADLRIGMFIHEMIGSWLGHPFWRPRFLLLDHDELRRLRASALREVWIDTERGVDVEEPTAGEREVEAAAAGVDAGTALPPIDGGVLPSDHERP